MGVARTMCEVGRRIETEWILAMVRPGKRDPVQHGGPS